jgi:solute:Na+ symporter, SSS family
MSAWLLGGFGLYLAFLAAAGLWRVRSEGGGLTAYFLASRSLSGRRVALTLVMSWFGASSILVSADEAWRSGLAAVWLIGVPAVLTLLVLLALARRLRAVPALTLPEFLELRYGRAVRGLAAALVVWYMILLAASQAAAAGQFLKSVLGASYVVSLAAALTVVMAYSLGGGLRAIVRTHVLQFIVLAGGLLALLAFLFSRTSLREAGEAASDLGRTGFFNPFSGWKTSLLTTLSFTLAWLVSPIAWQRLQAADSDRAARRGALSAAVILAGLYAAIVLIGVLSVASFPAADGRFLVARFIGSEAPRVLGVILFVSVLAAVLSTLDAAVNTGALSLAGDFFRRPGRPEENGRPARAGRLATLVVAAAVGVVSLRFDNVLQMLGLSSLVMAQGLFVPAAGVFLLRRRAPLAGLLGLLCGGGAALGSFLAEGGLLDVPWPPWPYSLPAGLALSLAGFLLGLSLESRASRPTG